MMTTIDEMFRSYCEEVISIDASPSQIIETRRAFYAGAGAAMACLSKKGVYGTVDDKNIKPVAGEILLFVDDVGRGMA